MAGVAAVLKLYVHKDTTKFSFRHQATAKHLQMFKLSIEKVTAIGIMGTSTNTFNLNDTLTRAQEEKCSTNYSKDQL